MDATKFVQTLMDGIAVGSIYALIALGYTMVYGILKFINFAHSDIFVLGAWTSLAIAMFAGWTTPQAMYAPAWVLLVGGFILSLTLLISIYEFLRGSPRFLPERLAASLPRVGVAKPLQVISGGILLVTALLWAARLLKASGSTEILSAFAILLGAMASCGTIGFTIERLAYRPLRNAPRLNVLITAIGVSLFLQNLGQLRWIFGTQPQRMPSLLPDSVLANLAGKHLNLGFLNLSADVQIHSLDLIGAGTAVLLMFALEWLVFHTKIGRAMRAVSYDFRIAALMGVPVDAIISFTFVLGSSLAAAAGFLYAMKYPGLNQPAHMTWILLGLKAFVAAVIGGIGNVRGAMLGGFLIGLLELFGAAYISASMRDVYVFSLLIVVLLVKPTGILGTTVAEKV